MTADKLSNRSILLIRPRVLLISIALLFAAQGLLIPCDAFSSSSKLQPGINKTDVKKIEPGVKEIQKPVIPKNIKKRTIIKSAAKPFLQIKKVYVFPKDNKLRVVIQNTGGGDLSRSDYFSGKLEIRLLGTSTKWWWSLANVKGKGDHYVTETIFNTKKIITQSTRLRVEIKGVPAGKPWIGTVLKNKKTKQKADIIVPSNIHSDNMVLKSGGMVPLRFSKPASGRIFHLGNRIPVEFEYSRPVSGILYFKYHICGYERQYGNLVDTVAHPLSVIRTGRRPDGGSFQIDPAVIYEPTLFDLDYRIVVKCYGSDGIRASGFSQPFSLEEVQMGPPVSSVAMDILQANSPHIESIRHLDGFYGTEFRVGEQIIVRGSNFGETSGGIKLDWQTTQSRGFMSCYADSWSDDSITFKIPLTLQEVVGLDAGQGLDGATVNIKVLPIDHQAYSAGKEITIYPDHSYYTPVITEHPTLIAPGQIYDIKGNYLYMPGGTHNLEVRIFTGSELKVCQIGPRIGRGLISFKVPEDLFLPDQQIEVDVYNTLGKYARFNANFVPKISKVIERTYSKYDSDNNSAFCNYDACCKNVAPYRIRRTNALAGKRLINSWKVENARVEVTRCKCAEINNVDLPSRLCRATITNAPVPGSNNPETSIRARFKPEYIRYKLYVTITGPSGTDHFR